MFMNIYFQPNVQQCLCSFKNVHIEEFSFRSYGSVQFTVSNLEVLSYFHASQLYDIFF